MTKAQIIQQLQHSYLQFIDMIQSLNEKEFCVAKEGKWSAGQQLDHLIRSTNPLTIAFSLPDWSLKFLFGKANRDSKAYEGLVEKYLKKLAEGGRASGIFIPRVVQARERSSLLKKLESNVNRLNALVAKYSEEQLDTLILPHPLLGKLTLREMLFFTIYHGQHHHHSVINNLAK